MNPGLLKFNIMAETVTKNNVYVGMHVTRGPNWEYGSQDFYPGNIGKVIDHGSSAATVVWTSRFGKQYSNTYRINTFYDLFVANIKSSGKYPELYHLTKNSIITISDPQGSDKVVAGQTYKILEIDQRTGVAVLETPTGPVEWQCMGNSEGHYFEYKPQETPQKAPERETKFAIPSAHQQLMDLLNS